MTPLAQTFARELTLPIKQRHVDDKAGLLSLIDQDMHCFEVSAIAGAVGKAMSEDNLWPEVAGMMPRLFLPSPVTWLEYSEGKKRTAFVIRQEGDRLRLDIATGGAGERAWSMPFCTFRARTPIELGERVEVIQLFGDEAKLTLQQEVAKPNIKISNLMMVPEPDQIRFMTRDQRRAAVERAVHATDLLETRIGDLNSAIAPLHAEQEMLRAANSGVVVSALILDLINTPGLVGLRQHDPHRALARQLQGLGIGRFPLRGWSEVVVKTHTRIADDGEHLSGPAFHKCLHFVRSHARHYRDGRVTIIPAHWRGDPALGIKRTRYRVEREAA